MISSGFLDKRHEIIFKNNISPKRIIDLEYVLQTNENMFFGCIRNGMNSFSKYNSDNFEMVSDR